MKSEDLLLCLVSVRLPSNSSVTLAVCDFTPPVKKKIIRSAVGLLLLQPKCLHQLAAGNVNTPRHPVKQNLGSENAPRTRRETSRYRTMVESEEETDSNC